MRNREILTAYFRQSFVLRDENGSIVDRKVIIERPLEESDVFAPEFNEMTLPLQYEERIQNRLPEPSSNQSWFYVLELFYKNDE